jgi:NAD(P)H-dependent FMN reductase
MSEHVARFVFEEVSKRDGVETELIDIREIPLPTTGAGEDIKDAKFSATVMRADALIIVSPEYNHGYPGLLKHVLDTNLKEYIHKAVGICGVSAGGFGGTRVIENLLPIMRELGLVTIFWDGNFSGVQNIFDASGKLLDQVRTGECTVGIISHLNPPRKGEEIEEQRRKTNAKKQQDEMS